MGLCVQNSIAKFKGCIYELGYYALLN